MTKINTDHLKELAETMDLIAQHQLDKASQIYYCVVKSVDDNQCTIVFNNKQYTVPYYGGKPTPNKTYAIFLPHNNMNESFVIGDGKDGGTEGKIIPISEGGTGADNAADARANLGLGNVANERQYSAENPPPAEYNNPTRFTNIVGISGVTINENRTYRIGKLVIVNIRFTASTPMNANSTILQGFPAPASSLGSAFAIVSLVSNRAGIPFAMVGSGEVMPTVNASAQMYVISGCYIAAN